MNKQEILYKLYEKTGEEKDETCKALVGNICDLIKFLSDDIDLKNFPLLASFLRTETRSRLDDIVKELESVLNELHNYLSKNPTKEIKAAAIQNMRNAKKKPNIIVISIFVAVAIVVLVFGILSAVGKISSVWCNVFGILDCVLGIGFFVYELYDDKLNKQKIDDGNPEIIAKYVIKNNIKTIEKGAKVAYGNIDETYNSPTVHGNGNTFIFNNHNWINSITMATVIFLLVVIIIVVLIVGNLKNDIKVSPTNPSSNPTDSVINDNISYVSLLIDNLRIVTLESKNEIEKAESAYDALSATEKSQIMNYDKLQSARSTYNILYTSHLIKGLGTITLNSKTAIEEAEMVYSVLNTTEKTQVNNYTELQSARNVYEVLYIIENLGTTTLESRIAIEEAESAYNALNATEIVQVSNYYKLKSARKVFDVMYNISSLGEITPNSKIAIEEAENVYNSLDKNEQALVSNYEDLTNARAYFDYISQFIFTLLSNHAYSIAAKNPSSLSGDVIIPNELEGISIIAITSDGFKNGSFTSITIPNGFVSIGESAFDGCVSLTKILIPSSITSIGDGAFNGCEKLRFNKFDKALYLGNENNNYVVLIKAENTSIDSCNINENTKVIYYQAFYDCSSLRSLIVPNGVTNIGGNAFQNCLLITSITIPSSVTSIGSSAFVGCLLITSITIPSSVTSIGNDVFFLCLNLKSVLVSPNNTKYCDVDGVLFNKDKTTLICYPEGKIEQSYVIPDGVQSIGNSAFLACTKLTSITISSSVTSVGDLAFYLCTSLKNIAVSPNNIQYCDVDGVLFDKDKTSLVYYPQGKTEQSYIIPNSIKSIDKGAFMQCNSLTSVTIPNSVTYIGDCAFKTSLEITFDGTVAVWNFVRKHSSWTGGGSLTIHCKDGDIQV